MTPILLILISVCPVWALETSCVVACLGDSITAGATLEKRIEQSYPGQLQVLLGETFRVDNLGVYGRTLMSLDGQSYLETGRVEYAINKQPDVVVIMLGTNDAKPDNWKNQTARFESDYRILLSKLQSGIPKARIFLCLPPHAWAPNKVQNDALEAQLPIIRRIAEENGCGLIDIRTVTADLSEHFKDGIHPDAEASFRIAEAVYQVLWDAGVLPSASGL